MAESTPRYNGRPLVRANVLSARERNQQLHHAHPHDNVFVLDFDDARDVFDECYPQSILLLNGQDVHHLALLYMDGEAVDAENGILIGTPVDEQDKLLPLPSLEIKKAFQVKFGRLTLAQCVELTPDIDIQGEDESGKPLIAFVHPFDEK